MDQLLVSERIKVERKVFTLELKENASGRFLRIEEDVNGRRTAIGMPATGLEQLQAALAKVIEAAGRLPEQTIAP